MSHGVEVALACVLLIATSVWFGGFVAIGVVARVTFRTLGPGDRVAFFRALGRMYGIVGTAALVVAIGTGAALVAYRPWDGTTATVVLTAALVAALAFGVLQARRMTRLRRDALASPDDAQLAARARRGARSAGSPTRLDRPPQPRRAHPRHDPGRLTHRSKAASTSPTRISPIPVPTIAPCTMPRAYRSDAPRCLARGRCACPFTRTSPGTTP